MNYKKDKLYKILKTTALMTLFSCIGNIESNAVQVTEIYEFPGINQAYVDKDVPIALKVTQTEDGLKKGAYLYRHKYKDVDYYAPWVPASLVGTAADKNGTDYVEWGLWDMKANRTTHNITAPYYYKQGKIKSGGATAKNANGDNAGTLPAGTVITIWGIDKTDSKVFIDANSRSELSQGSAASELVSIPLSAVDFNGQTKYNIMYDGYTGSTESALILKNFKRYGKYTDNGRSTHYGLSIGQWKNPNRADVPSVVRNQSGEWRYIGYNRYGEALDNPYFVADTQGYASTYIYGAARRHTPWDKTDAAGTGESDAATAYNVFVKGMTTTGLRFEYDKNSAYSSMKDYVVDMLYSKGYIKTKSNVKNEFSLRTNAYKQGIVLKNQRKYAVNYAVPFMQGALRDIYARRMEVWDIHDNKRIASVVSDGSSSKVITSGKYIPGRTYEIRLRLANGSNVSLIKDSLQAQFGAVYGAGSITASMVPSKTKNIVSANIGNKGGITSTKHSESRDFTFRLPISSNQTGPIDLYGFVGISHTGVDNLDDTNDLIGIRLTQDPNPVPDDNNSSCTITNNGNTKICGGGDIAPTTIELIDSNGAVKYEHHKITNAYGYRKTNASINMYSERGAGRLVSTLSAGTVLTLQEPASVSDKWIKVYDSMANKIGYVNRMNLTTLTSTSEEPYRKTNASINMYSDRGASKLLTTIPKGTVLALREPASVSYTWIKVYDSKSDKVGYVNRMNLTMLASTDKLPETYGVTLRQAIIPGEKYKIRYTAKFTGETVKVYTWVPPVDDKPETSVDESKDGYWDEPVTGSYKVPLTYTVERPVKTPNTTESYTYNGDTIYFKANNSTNIPMESGTDMTYTTGYIVMQYPKLTTSVKVTSTNTKINSNRTNDTFSTTLDDTFDISATKITVKPSVTYTDGKATNINYNITYDANLLLPSYVTKDDYQAYVNTAININGKIYNVKDQLAKGDNSEITHVIENVPTPGNGNITVAININSDRLSYESGDYDNNKISTTVKIQKLQDPTLGNPNATVQAPDNSNNNDPNKGGDANNNCLIPRTKNIWTTTHKKFTWSSNTITYNTLVTKEAVSFQKYKVDSYTDNAATDTYTEEFGIKQILFKSKETVDKKRGSNGWVDLLIPEQAKYAEVKAGYGFELKIVTKYSTDALSKRTWSISNNGYNGSSVRLLNGGINYGMEDVFLELPGTTGANGTRKILSSTGYGGSIQGLNVTKTENGNSAVWSYTIKPSNTLGIGETPKIYIPQEMKDGDYKLKVYTTPMQGVGSANKKQYSSLCDRKEVTIKVKGANKDDLGSNIIQ